MHTFSWRVMIDNDGNKGQMSNFEAFKSTMRGKWRVGPWTMVSMWALKMTGMKQDMIKQDMKMQDMKLQDMKLQDMTNISLLLFLPIPVILAVLWKIWCNIYSLLFISSSIVDKNW